MKKVISLLMVAVLSFTLLFTMTGCEDEEIPATISKDGIDYDRMIESFVPDHFNTKELAVGEVDGPKARVWLQNGMGTVYTSDEKVVTVSDLGKVTAVGPGQAYVVITGMGSTMFEVYQYTVSGTKKEKNTVHATIFPKVTEEQ